MIHRFVVVLLLGAAACGPKTAVGPTPTPQPIPPPKAALVVTAPNATQALTPLAQLVVTFSAPVKETSSFDVTLSIENNPDPQILMASMWSDDRKTLTLVPRAPLPTHRLLRLKVTGAKDGDGDAFGEIDLVLHTTANEPLRAMHHADTGDETQFAHVDSRGYATSIVILPGNVQHETDATPTACQHNVYTDTTFEYRQYGSAGADGVFCTDDDVGLSDYFYDEETATRSNYGSASDFGADGKPRTADDVDPFYSVAFYGFRTRKDCNVGAGTDGLFFTDDDVLSKCTCRITDAAPPAGLTSREWSSKGECDQTTATSYTDTKSPVASGDGTVVVETGYTAATPGSAAPADVVFSTTTHTFDAHGLETETRRVASFEHTRERTTYDDNGNKIDSVKVDAGVDLVFDSPDDVVIDQNTYDTAH